MPIVIKVLINVHLLVNELCVTVKCLYYTHNDLCKSYSSYEAVVPHHISGPCIN